MDLGDYPGLWPGIIASLFISLALCIPVGRVTRISAPNAWLLLFGLGIIFAATLTPSLEAISEGALGSGRCDLSRFTPTPIGELRTINQYSLNVMLFIPLGIAIGVIPRERDQATFAVAALALPIAIESIQLAVVQLDRACQSGDVVDNLFGLGIGFIIGFVIAGVARGIVRLVTWMRRVDTPV